MKIRIVNADLGEVSLRGGDWNVRDSESGQTGGYVVLYAYSTICVYDACSQLTSMLKDNT